MLSQSLDNIKDSQKASEEGGAFEQDKATDKNIEAKELKKIIEAQKIRNRSQSMVSGSPNAGAVLPPIRNFGHRKRSNL